MRILLVVHGYPPAAVGGSEIYAEAHARALRRLGDDVLVLAREADPARPEWTLRHETRDGVEIVLVNNTFRASRSFDATYRDHEFRQVASRVVDEFRPNLAHIHHLTGLGTDIVTELRDRKVPTVMTLHDYWLLCHRGQLLDPDLRVCDGPEPDGCARCVGLAGAVGPAGHASASALRSLERHVPNVVTEPMRRVAQRAARVVADPDLAKTEARRRLEHMRAMCARVTHFLAPSETVRQRFVEFGIPDLRISTVELGIDVEPYRGSSRMDAEPIRFGFVGSLMVSKAPHLLLEAFRRLPAGSATLDIYGSHAGYHGDESYTQRVQPLLAGAGVRMHGAVPHERIPDVLSAIDVLVVPSVWPETAGLVIREAFRAGAVVVASRIGAFPEAVTDEVNGLLFPAGDLDELTEALTRLVEDRGLLPVLRRGIPAVRSIDEDVQWTRTLYARLLAAAATPARATTRRDLAAVVLNFQTPDDTVLAVRSLLASRRRLDQIIVVDNGGSGACREALRAVADDVTLVECGTNLGFSGGMNAGLGKALELGADRVLFVNSDVFVPPDCVARLEEALEAGDHVGIAGPVVLSRSSPGTVSTLGMDYRADTGRMRHRGSGEPAADVQLPESAEVDAVSGCLMLVDRDVFAAVGSFEDDFFFGFEDLDLCLRARRAGFATVLAGRAKALHEGGRSIGAESPRRLYFAARNHLLAAQRAAPDLGHLRAGARFASIVSLNLAHAVRSRGAALPIRLAAVVRGTLDYALGRFGSPG